MYDNGKINTDGKIKGLQDLAVILETYRSRYKAGVELERFARKVILPRHLRNVHGLIGRCAAYADNHNNK